MTKLSVVRSNRDGPEGKGLPLWGHLENEAVIEGSPTTTGRPRLSSREALFVLSRGFGCIWHLPEMTGKYDVIFEAKS